MKKSEIKWRFQSNQGGEINGISDPGIESFKGTPLKSLAREICQNSLDAQKENDKPVIVRFASFKVKKSDIPGISDIESNPIKKGLDFWSVQKDEKAKKFYMNALSKLNDSEIQILKISDFNTEGLRGCNEKVNSPFLNLVKSSGASDKKITSGGAFGIGKYATFACSDIRTVFYSTLNDDNEEASLGVARLASFYINESNQDIAKGVSFYGNGDMNGPIPEQFTFKNIKKRVKGETGTDIYIVAFKSYGDKWINEIIGAVIDGFLYSIYKGNLVFEINDITISKENLDAIFNQYSESIPANAKDYYFVLKDDKTKWYSEDYEGMGTINLGLSLDKNLNSRRVAMIRKTGMKIFDKGALSSQIIFSGVLLIEGEKINAYLKSLENPQHTQWEPDRDPDDNKSHAEKVISGLTRFIKKKINELKGESEVDSVDPGLGNFLPYDDGNAESKKKSDILSVEETEIKITKRELKSDAPIPSIIEKVAEGNEASSYGDTPIGTGVGSKGKNGGTGDKSGSGNCVGDKQLGKVKITPIQIKNTRIIATNKTNGEYKIKFIPTTDSENCNIKILQSAENDSYSAAIKSFNIEGQSNAKMDNFIIKNVSIKKDTPLVIRLCISSHDYNSFEVVCYENK